MLKARSRKPEARGRRSEAGGQRSEVGKRSAEIGDGGWKAEKRTEDGGQETKYANQLGERFDSL